MLPADSNFGRARSGAARQCLCIDFVNQDRPETETDLLTNPDGTAFRDGRQDAENEQEDNVDPSLLGGSHLSIFDVLQDGSQK